MYREGIEVILVPLMRPVNKGGWGHDFNPLRGVEAPYLKAAWPNDRRLQPGHLIILDAYYGRILYTHIIDASYRRIL